MLARSLVAMVMLATIILAGCKEPEPETPPPPPLPTEGAIYRTLQDSLSVILVRGGPTDEELTQSMNRFQQALNENVGDATLYPPEQIQAYQDARRNARRSIQGDIETRLRASRDAGGWRIVYGCILAFEVLQPGSDRYENLLDKAIKMINKPTVTSGGAIERDGVFTVVLKIDDQANGINTTENVRQGQYFYNNRFRLLEIIGDNSAYLIEYCDVDDHTFRVESTER